jgi:Thrombospondin type 3 repeat
MQGRTTAAFSGYDDVDRDASITRRGAARRRPVGVWASILAAVVGVLVLSIAAPASAATFAESGDAGDTRASASIPNVSPLSAISGRVSPESDRDLYTICLAGGQFTAQTSTASDPILGLFSEDGTLVAQNDDSGSVESRIDGVFTPGTYYLAITSYANFSEDADTVPGDMGYHTFDYTISLTGADSCVSDSDSDGVSDDTDNCANVANPDQVDADQDGKGAACDTQEFPLIKEDCKNGGWHNFDGTATFNNQGDCVSYVATGGTNPPRGSH